MVEGKIEKFSTCERLRYQEDVEGYTHTNTKEDLKEESRRGDYLERYLQAF